MKKIISLVLVIILMLSVAVMPAYSQTYNKMTQELVSALEIADDTDMLCVAVTLRDTIDSEELERLIFEACGFTNKTATTLDERNLYRETRNEVLKRYYEPIIQALLDKIGANESEVEIFSMVSPNFAINISKSKICEMAELDEVVSLALHGIFIKAQPDHLFEEIFIEQYKDSIRNAYEYDELYYHYDSEGNMDWAYIKAIVSDPSVAYSYAVYGDMVCLLGSVMPFGDYYGVYDVAQGKFISACMIDDLSAYDGLKELVYKREFLEPIGDFDRDGKLTIIDATGIQRALAGLDDFPYDDNLEEMWYFRIGKELKYFTDFDRDGQRTVLDATAIQYKLAGLD